LFLQKKYKSFSDLELIDGYVKNDNNVFIGELYNRYSHLVLGLCIKYLKNKDDASDAVIQIFSNLLTDLKKHKINYFKSWLYVYSKNYCLMQLRKRQSELKKELELKENAILIMDFSNPEHLNEKEAQINKLEVAIDQLNSDQKTCIELFYLQSKSYQEIEQITGLTNNEVKSHIQNGKRNLKIKLTSENE
jgi:RNA polymerase sigma-70 factor (ECF subfamily)